MSVVGQINGRITSILLKLKNIFTTRI